jgi:hypothetical protein
MEWSAAGLLFTNGTTALGGYQPYKQIPCISGLGGKREACDQYPPDTAFREALEELFGLETVPSVLLNLLTIIFSFPDHVLCSMNYIQYVYSFEDLLSLLHICNDHGLVSPLYDVFPVTLDALVLKRKVRRDTELSHLALVPVLLVAPVLDPFFQSDLEKIRMDE